MRTVAADLRTLSREAYIYLYPLVTTDETRRQQINGATGSKPGFGPPNQFHHIRTFPDATFRTVVRPNFDTLYSSAWIDLGKGPVQVHAPDSGDRFYMLPMLDAWTDVFASPGTRTTGTGPQDYLLVGPGYRGDPPPDIPVIHAPTHNVWIIARPQTNGPADYATVNAFQDGLRIIEIGERAPFEPDPTVESSVEPLHVVESLSATDFFRRGAAALAVDPPHLTDFSQLARIEPLGIVPGRQFDADRFAAAELDQIEAGVADARAAITNAPRSVVPPVDGWVTLNTGVYGNDYLTRAAIAKAGLGANPPEDAIYPLLLTDSEGKPPMGDSDYTIHFDADRLPPVDAFWSITMYDAEGFQTPNELNRFAIGDRDPLRYNSDGSLDIYISHTNPGPDRESNWLPAPLGPLGITLRLYAPHPAALDRTWTPPPLHKVG
ncbi:DUF1254 domain-containing protein [Nocardia cyriacigeorgica]|uniref:DUF1254 domain-containing protein n=1 Tax=Nocardia cyriacigeorgica (strain GUH-2) TaxID=1127134 RepID=H6R5N9_NOCCG|nr:DUF1254 domain-containing protein [Nocardia cyriacigeorgica]BDT87018.1 membrane protein [Nocardia cyriacigeorgica]CCF63370.1 conserved protein of unknown function [Nocardia cyriacigeorgica GUH-2]